MGERPIVFSRRKWANSMKDVQSLQIIKEMQIKHTDRSHTVIMTVVKKTKNKYENGEWQTQLICYRCKLVLSLEIDYLKIKIENYHTVSSI